MRDLSCERVQEILDAYIEQELETHLQDAVRQHLDRCAACRQEAEQLAQGLSLLRSFPRRPAPEHVRDRVLSAISVMDRPRPMGWRLGRLAAGLAASVLAVICGALVWTFLPSRQDTPSVASLPKPIAQSSNLPRPDAPPVPVDKPPTTVMPSVQVASREAVAEPARRRVPSAPTRQSTSPTPPAMPESFLDVADSRGVTARDLMYGQSQTLAGAREVGVYSQVAAPGVAQETLNERVRIGERVTELQGFAEWDETGRLRAMRIRAETVDDRENATSANFDG